MGLKDINDNWKLISSAATAFAAAIAIVWRRYVRRHVAKFRANLRKLDTLPSIQEEAAMKADQEKMLKEIWSQLHPNGGSSVLDILNRLDREIHLQRAANWAMRGVTGDPIWQSDAAGRWIIVSSALSEMMDADQNDVLGLGWVNAIYREDRQHVVAEWQAAVQQERQFSETFRLRHENGTIINVSGHATPLRDRAGVVSGFLGALRLLPDGGH